MTSDGIDHAAQAVGLTVLGTARDGERVVCLLGLSRGGWDIFSADPEYADGKPNPLDRWSQRVVGALGENLGGEALFPFGGPPYQPFMRWAAASGVMWPSPLGMSIHRDHGLWMSFRGALGFAASEGIVADADAVAVRPCDSCISQPCLNACPVDAFRAGGEGERYDVAACAAHVSAPEGAACRERGCLARRACWVGQDWVPEPKRARFHMAAFLAARSEA